MSQSKLHVVNLIPTYNEAENIILMLEALDDIANQNTQYEFSTLVVDDNSPDGTGELVKQYQTQHSQVHLLTGQKKGLGAALIKGYQHAINQLHADVIVSNDVDFQFDPYDIPRMLAKIDQGYDVVVASRHTPGGSVEGWPIGRHFTHWVANDIFATWVAGTHEVKDHNGNFRAIRVKNTLDQIPWNQLPAKGYGFLNMMIYQLSLIPNIKFTEVPVKFRWRERGETKVSFNRKYVKTFFRDTFEYIILCLNIRLNRLKQLA